MVLRVFLKKVPYFILKSKNSVKHDSFIKNSQNIHIDIVYFNHERRSDNKNITYTLYKPIQEKNNI